jgi:predicted DNA-binding transcriptional regulator AlpA
MTNQQYINARQVFERYGIPRSALNRLVDDGRLTVRTIETSVAFTKLYSVEEIEKIIAQDNY